MPAEEFATAWEDSRDTEGVIRRLSRRFRVSRYVIAIRAYESGLLARSTLDDLLDQYDANARARSGNSGGDFYRTTIARNGRSFTDGVLGALGRQRVLIRDAAALLEVRPAHLVRLGQELRRRG